MLYLFFMLLISQWMNLSRILVDRLVVQLRPLVAHVHYAVYLGYTVGRIWWSKLGGRFLYFLALFYSRGLSVLGVACNNNGIS